MSSSQVWPRKAFILSGRLIVIQATPLRTAYRMSSKSMVLPWGECLPSNGRGSAVHGQAARDAEDLGRDEAGVVAGKKGNGAGQVFGPTQAPERNGAFESLDELGRVAGGAATRRIGRDVGDAAGAALRHAGQRRMVHVQRAGQVDGNQSLPLGGHRPGEGLEYVPAGVVHQHVD